MDIYTATDARNNETFTAKTPDEARSWLNERCHGGTYIHDKSSSCGTVFSWEVRSCDDDDVIGWVESDDMGNEAGSNTAAIENLRTIQTPAEQLDEAYRQLDQMDATIRLRSFAMQHNELAFAHMCITALQGEAWAVERLAKALRVISRRSETIRGAGHMQEQSRNEVKLEVIRETNTTRPDGAIARSVEV